MYDNIGSKIKGLAIVVFIIGTIISVIVGFNSGRIGVLIVILGPVLAWMSSWITYGFGELVEKVCDIEENIRGGQAKTEETVEKSEIETTEISEAEMSDKTESEVTDEIK